MGMSYGEERRSNTCNGYLVHGRNNSSHCSSPNPPNVSERFLNELSMNRDGLVMVAQSSVRINQACRETRCKRSNNMSLRRYFFFEMNSDSCLSLVRKKKKKRGVCADI